MPDVVVANGLTKSYRSKEVLRGLSFAVPEGRVTALLGPNGAGKTTCIRILTTSLLPSAGNVQVLGFDVVTDASRVRRHIAVVPQEALTDPDLTAWESVYGYLLARGMDRRSAAHNAEVYLRQMDLWEVRHQVTARYSGGMKRRTLLAMALASGARLIFLDEPTTGLDPVAKREVWTALSQLRTQTTFVLTTHLMDEVEAVADRVIVVTAGQILAQGTVEELVARAPGREKVSVARSVPAGALQLFGPVREDGGRWVCFPRNPESVHEIVDLARMSGASVNVGPATLEDAYLSLVQTDSGSGQQVLEVG